MFPFRHYITNTVQYSGIGTAKVALATSPAYYIDAGCRTDNSGITTYYKAIGIAWANDVLTFVLSNEAPGYLIDDLITAGYGDSNLYEALGGLQSASGGVISDAFLETLALCPPGSEIFTAKLSDFAGLNNPVCINADGTLSINGIFGRDYHGQTGYATYPPSGGRESFTYAISPQYYIDAGSSSTPDGTTEYKAFAIAWSDATDPDPNAGGEIIVALILSSDFNEKYYLARYQDVAGAVQAGLFGTGWEHYSACGKNEGRSYAKPANYGNFNETYYLARNPDVDRAVHTGLFGTGWEHYVLNGKSEGRSYAKPEGYATVIKTYKKYIEGSSGE